MFSMERQSSPVNPLRLALVFSVLGTISYTIPIPLDNLGHRSRKCTSVFGSTALDRWKELVGRGRLGLGPGTWGTLCECSTCLAGSRAEPERDAEHYYTEHHQRDERDRIAAGHVAQ